MSGDPMTMALLYDFYGETLTDRQRDFFDLYHNGDLSLAEIAEQEGISRQAVRDALARAEASLRALEDKIGLMGKFLSVKALLGQITVSAEAIAAVNARYGENMYIRARSEDIRRAASEIYAVMEK